MFDTRFLPHLTVRSGRVERLDLASALPAMRAAFNTPHVTERTSRSTFPGETMEPRNQVDVDVVTQVVGKAFSKVQDNLDRFSSAQRERTKELGESIEELKTRQGEVQARQLAVEQMVTRRPAGGGTMAISDPTAELREALAGSSDLRAVSENRLRRAVIDLPPNVLRAAIMTSDVSTPQTFPRIVAPVQRRLTVRSLLTTIPVDSSAVQYVKETGFTNNAAPVSETTEKPESTLTFELQTAPIVVIAHYFVTSVQALADSPQLAAYIAGRGVYGHDVVVDQQILKGSGSGNNLTGLTVAATAYDRAESPETKIDTLRRAITQLELTDYVASGIVLNPADWEEISLVKDSTGQYVLGSPGGANPRMLWNLPVVSTPTMNAGDFLVADFAQAAVVLDREQARIDISTEDSDNFRKNLATVRIESRLGLAILRPGALIKGVF
jgi:HK97 family phage major capsid protein